MTDEHDFEPVECWVVTNERGVHSWANELIVGLESAVAPLDAGEEEAPAALHLTRNPRFSDTQPPSRRRNYRATPPA